MNRWGYEVFIMRETFNSIDWSLVPTTSPTSMTSSVWLKNFGDTLRWFSTTFHRASIARWRTVCMEIIFDDRRSKELRDRWLLHSHGAQISILHTRTYVFSRVSVISIRSDSNKMVRFTNFSPELFYVLQFSRKPSYPEIEHAWRNRLHRDLLWSFIVRVSANLGNVSFYSIFVLRVSRYSASQQLRSSSADLNAALCCSRVIHARKWTRVYALRSGFVSDALQVPRQVSE